MASQKQSTARFDSEAKSPVDGAIYARFCKIVIEIKKKPITELQCIAEALEGTVQ